MSGEGTSYFGANIEQILEGLRDGATGELGGDTMGYILQLIFGGGSGQQDILDDMNKKVNEILAMQEEILNKLDELLNEIEITKDEIIANTNDPTNAISKIDTSYKRLKGLSTAKAGTVSKETILAFIEYVENTEDIYNRVDRINSAILPLTSVKIPVIDNLVDLALTECNSSSSWESELASSYAALEKYFMQLIYWQLMGVNLIIETKVFRKKNNMPQIDNYSAKQYLDLYVSQMLVPQVENFMKNVSRLILNQSHMNVVETNFLPQNTADILSRANFFHIQALNQAHYGLRGSFIATIPMDEALSLRASNDDSGDVYQSEKSTFSRATGVRYDYWKYHDVKPSTQYNICTYDFGDLPVGPYSILDDNNKSLAKVDVETYKADYTKSSEGKIKYGHFLSYDVPGAKLAFSQNAHWHWWSKDCYNVNVRGSGTAGDRYTHLDQNVSYVDDKDTYHGTAELDSAFTFNGDRGEGVTVHYSATAYGKANVDGVACGGSTISYEILLYDNTTHQTVRDFASNKKESSSWTRSIDEKPSGSFFFHDPSPGHEYYVAFVVHIEGEAIECEVGAEMSLKDMVVYLTF